MVADTGVGLSAEAQASLWQAFRTASRWQSGTGLGLYHVRELVEALGGSVGYQANLQAGNGAVFWVDLPYSPTSAPPPPPPRDGLWPRTRSSSAPSDGAALSLSRSRQDSALVGWGDASVLIAEDNAFILELTVELLHSIGCAHTVAVSNGVEALQHLTAADAPEFVLVLMDVQMPFLDGIECTRRLRAWEATHRAHAPRLRVVALSANGHDDACRRDCQQAGMDDVVAKPIARDHLRRLLEESVGESAVAAKAAASAVATASGEVELDRSRAHAPVGGSGGGRGGGSADDESDGDDSFIRLAKSLAQETTAKHVSPGTGESSAAPGAASALGGSVLGASRGSCRGVAALRPADGWVERVVARGDAAETVAGPPSADRDTEAAPMVLDYECVLRSVGGDEAA